MVFVSASRRAKFLNLNTPNIAHPIIVHIEEITLIVGAHVNIVYEPTLTKFLTQSIPQHSGRYDCYDELIDIMNSV